MTHKQNRHKMRVDKAISRLVRQIKHAFEARLYVSKPTTRYPWSRETSYLRLAERDELLRN